MQQIEQRSARDADRQRHQLGAGQLRGVHEGQKQKWNLVA
jgi:hypothetical protein